MKKPLIIINSRNIWVRAWVVCNEILKLMKMKTRRTFLKRMLLSEKINVNILNDAKLLLGCNMKVNNKISMMNLEDVVL